MVDNEYGSSTPILIRDGIVNVVPRYEEVIRGSDVQVDQTSRQLRTDWANTLVNRVFEGLNPSEFKLAKEVVVGRPLPVFEDIFYQNPTYERARPLVQPSFRRENPDVTALATLKSPPATFEWLSSF